jgi:hypothetical protein
VEDEMRRNTRKIRWLLGVGTAAALLAPVSQAGSLKPLPPIDAGSDQPNPVYVAAEAQPVPPLDAGTAVPNPVYTQRHDERVGLPIAQPTASVRPSNGFDWGDAGIGAGVALGATLLASAAGAAGVRVRRARVAGAYLDGSNRAAAPSRS